MKYEKLIQSPLNYTGGKYKLLPQILPLFPENIDTFVDLFCGGCNVGINIKSNNVIYNDIDLHLHYLFETFKNLDKQSIFDWIYQIIDKYELSNVSKYGYEYYNCTSAAGVGNYNKEKFLKLREDFNKNISEDYYYYVMLYVLIVYSFNNQIRFNSKNEFNLPVGKRDFNEKMVKKLSNFLDRIKEQNCSFTCNDFREFNSNQLKPDDFVYIDPPYLITCATYNEQGGWNEKLETELLSFIDSLSENNIRCALSNVLRSKGKENSILLSWLENNKQRYKAIPLNFSYSNSNYHTKDRQGNTEEVLIINY